MLALAWRWANSSGDQDRELSRRLGASLCAGIGGRSVEFERAGIHFAYRPLQSSKTSNGTWRPAIMPDGRLAVFHGYLDNAPQIAAILGEVPDQHALLHGLAVEKWGDQADLK